MENKKTLNKLKGIPKSKIHKEKIWNACWGRENEIRLLTIDSFKEKLNDFK